MVPNHPYFVVRINKALQEKKRTELETFIYPSLGIFHDESLHHPPAQPRGIAIDRIDPEGAAAKAGFSIGDTIVSFNHEKVERYEHLQELLSTCEPGEEVTIGYFSQFSIQYTHEVFKIVTLGSREVKIHLPNVTDMDRNLQWGTIVSIGSVAAAILPTAKQGDILLIHHLVEYKPRMDGEEESLYNDSALMGIDANGDELRIADARTQVFGVLNKEGVIYPHPDYIFCERKYQPAAFQMKDGLWIPDGYELQHEEMVAKLEAYKAQYESLTSASVLQERTTDKNYRTKEQIGEEVNKINKYREELSIKMNQPKLVEVTVRYINAQSSEFLGAAIQEGDILIADQSMLYPLQVERFNFLLVRTRYTLALKANNANISNNQ